MNVNNLNLFLFFVFFCFSKLAGSTRCAYNDVVRSDYVSSDPLLIITLQSLGTLHGPDLSGIALGVRVFFHELLLRLSHRREGCGLGYLVS
jgi:hypothetical protein